MTFQLGDAGDVACGLAGMSPLGRAQIRPNCLNLKDVWLFRQVSQCKNSVERHHLGSHI